MDGATPQEGAEPGFRDHFSGHSEAYRRHRPTYPAALFEALAEAAPGRGLAVDVGTGSGQAARALADRFERVIGIDGSRSQLEAAVRHERIDYRIGRAEATGLEAGVADLVVVAQALHWFDVEAFNREAARILRRSGVIAAWTYALCRISPAIDAVIEAFHDGPIRAHWPDRRTWVDAGYEGLPFPWARIPMPEVEMTADWTLDRFMGYLDTWSGVRRYRAAQGEDPLPALRAKLAEEWGDPSRARLVRWPLKVLAGRHEPAGDVVDSAAPG